MHLLLLSLGFQTSPPPPRPAPPATPAPRVLPALHDPPDLSALPAPPAHAALPGPPALPSPSRSSFFALSSLPASPPCFRWAFLAWRATLHHSLACWTYSGYRRRWNKRRMRCLFHTLLSVDPFSEGGGSGPLLTSLEAHHGQTSKCKSAWRGASLFCTLLSVGVSGEGQHCTAPCLAGVTPRADAEGATMHDEMAVISTRCFRPTCFQRGSSGPPLAPL